MLFDMSTLISLSSFWPRSLWEGRTKDVVQSSYCKHIQLHWDTCLVFDICLDDPFFYVSLARVRIYYMFDLIQVAPNHPSPYPTVFQSCCLLSMFYFFCFITIII